MVEVTVYIDISTSSFISESHSIYKKKAKSFDSDGRKGKMLFFCIVLYMVVKVVMFFFFFFLNHDSMFSES